MNDLVKSYLEDRKRKLEHAALLRACADMKKAQDEVYPMIRAANERRRAAERMDGTTGFVMVQR